MITKEPLLLRRALVRAEVSHLEQSLASGDPLDDADSLRLEGVKSTHESGSPVDLYDGAQLGEPDSNRFGNQRLVRVLQLLDDDGSGRL